MVPANWAFAPVPLAAEAHSVADSVAEEVPLARPFGHGIGEAVGLSRIKLSQEEVAQAPVSGGEHRRRFGGQTYR